MRLTVIGCSGSFPGPDSPASCYLLEHEDVRILLDMGNGSLGSLQRYADIYALDGVVLSHLHVDHFIDLCSYYVALRYRPQGPGPVVPVWGPEGTADRLAAAYGMSPGADMRAELDVRRIEESFSIGPFVITTEQMVHPIESRAIRVEAGGRSLTYSGDTGPTAALSELAKGCDLALFEASFRSSQTNPPDLHLTGGQAARLAADADVGHLILTHLVPWNSVAEIHNEAAVVFPHTTMARTGLSREV